ncbi:YhgE/Pip domain-containing protein [Nakamurella flava]|uniref:YhgE/Pip domain-containing protein n=1 Tax=Nakamurella flava TaxID=2576308 RepID=A0A4U6QE20_9ACTN|nr:YhgE/Pip domain-containing protein [Nakamurella flava]TKV58477.1 YhgE/Pip domain-containing protein [Nakamurella flava]
MIKTFRLAGFELRRFRGTVPKLALVFVTLIPLLYGALYLWSNWDPYGKLDQIPVAVVNQDQAVTGPNDAVVDAGDRFVAQLQNEKIFDWKFTDEATARKGLAEGHYYLVILVPPDFSANLASGSGTDPRRAIMQVRRDDANGYVVGLLSASVQDKLEAAVDRAAIGAYFDAVFANLDQIRGNLDQAASAAGQLGSGAQSALDGSNQLATGLTSAKGGADQLVTGLTDAKTGSTNLVSGAQQAQSGASSLSSGLSSLQTGANDLVSGSQRVADGNNTLASAVVPILNDAAALGPQIATAGQNVAAGAAQVTSLVSTGANSLNSQLTTANTALNQLRNQYPNDPAVESLTSTLIAIDGTGAGLAAAAGQINTAAATVNQVAADVNSQASGGAFSQAAQQITDLASGAQQVASGASQLSGGIDQAASGAASLDTGLQSLSSGATQLDSGIGSLQTGAQSLSDGIGQLQTGTTSLTDGLTQLQSGATQLQQQLSAGAARIPALSPDQQQDAAQVLSAPVELQETVDNPAGVYGRGLAPFFFAIAIWVFGISVFLVMRPISLRALAGRASSLRIAFAGWLPIVGLCLLGSWILLLVSWFALGLNPVNVGGAFGLVALAAIAFTAIAHLLRTALGVVGSAITLVLLMVQLTGSGGLYPVETLPLPLRVIHPYLPMSYLIDGFRIVFTGGPTDHLWRDVAVLTGTAVLALGLTVFAVSRRRRFSVRDLHPVLQT